jgi:hypothetical protein
MIHPLPTRLRPRAAHFLVSLSLSFGGSAYEASGVVRIFAPEFLDWLVRRKVVSSLNEAGKT